MLNTLLILLRFLPYILIFSAGFYLKGCMTDKLISDLKNQVIENQEKIIITERKLNDYNNNVVTQTFDFIKKNDEIFNSAIKFDFNGLYQRADGAEVSNIESSSGPTKERSNKSSDKYRAEYNRCISELEGFYRKELEKSNNPLALDIEKYSHGARCTFSDFCCAEDCKIKEGKTLIRKI